MARQRSEKLLEKRVAQFRETEKQMRAGFWIGKKESNKGSAASG